MHLFLVLIKLVIIATPSGVESKRIYMSNENSFKGLDPAMQSKFNAKRAEFKGYSSLAGETLCVVKVGNIDLKHNDKVREGKYFMLKNAAKQVYLEVIDLFAVSPVENPLTGELQVMFNNDQRLTFKLSASPEIQKPTREALNEAINLAKADEVDRPYFFNDRKSLVELISAINKETSIELEKLAEDLLNQSRALTDLNSLMITQTTEYYKNLG